MNHRPDLVRLITQGASEAEIVKYFQNERKLSQFESYALLEDAGIEFGRITNLAFRKLPDDGISEERRKYLQDLSLEP